MAESLDKSRSGPRGGWVQLTVCISLLTVSALLALGLTLQYWQNRPINYTQHTALLADEVESVLEEQFVPASHIQRGAPERRDSDTSTAYWNFYRFEVALPPTMSPEGLKELVAGEMRLRNVNLVSVNEPGAVAAWSLGRGDLEFARVLLQRPAAEEVRRSDLRELSLSVADSLARVLADTGVAPETIVRSAAVERDDARAEWTMTRFAAMLPPGYSPGELRADLDARLSLEGVSTSTERAGYSTMVAVKYGERRFAEVLAAPALAPPEETAAPTADEAMDEAPEDSALAMEAMTPPPPRETATAATEFPPLETIELTPEVVIEPLETEAESPEPEMKPMRVRIAILLDDGGNNRAQCERVLGLDTGLTLAILPHTPHGLSTAREGAKLGFEIMLHMPMETESEDARRAEGTVLTTMSAKGIRWQMERALASLTAVKGVNNHTGSKFTSDAKAMGAVLEVVKEHGLYFVDSWTGSDSVAYALAREMGVKAAHRDVFLDNDRTAVAIARQYEELLERARENGSAIGIGHFQSPHTLALLERELPKLKTAGIELVHASELLR